MKLSWGSIPAILCLLLLTSAAAAQVPSRLCVRDNRLDLTVDTQALTFEARVDETLYKGQFAVLFWEPALFYIAGSGTAPGFSFYANISFLRHASFADVRANGQSFRATNADHCDCDGNPPTVPPYAIRIEGVQSGIAPFKTTLRIIPTDNESLSNYQWCINEKMVVGQIIELEFKEPGRYEIEGEGFYNDIRAEADAIIEVTAPTPDNSSPPPRPEPPVNHPPSVKIFIPEVIKKKREVTFKAVAEDPDGDPLLIEWSCSDGGRGTGSEMIRSFRKGSYSCSCHVADGRGGEASSTVMFAVPRSER